MSCSLVQRPRVEARWMAFSSAAGGNKGQRLPRRLARAGRTPGSPALPANASSLPLLHWVQAVRRPWSPIRARTPTVRVLLRNPRYSRQLPLLAGIHR